MTTNQDASHEVARFCLDRGLVDLVRFKQAETQCKASGKALYDVLVSSHLVDDFSPEDAKTAKPYHGAGCEKCNHTGYKGRQGIYEVLKISEPMRAARQMVLDGLLTIEEYQSNLVFN